MSLLQISEPNQSARPHEHRYALGIDLGTTHSLVGVVRSSRADILSFGESPLLPSVVYYGIKADKPVVGANALTYDDPKNTIVSAKRFMGRVLDDIKFSHPYELVADNDTMPCFVTAQGDKSPVEVSAHILAHLYNHAKASLPKDSIVGAVITVPAYFDEAQRQATKDAAQSVGLSVLRLLNEPTAAAIAYGLDQSAKQGLYLIYDLGGGTFDVSVLRLADGVFEVLATGGNSALGGDDIDRLIANYFIKQAGLDPKTVDNAQKSALARLAKSYKQTLSAKPSVSVDIEINGQSLSIVLSQSDLQAICQPVSERTLKICTQVLSDAGIDKALLNEVVLVGGSTRMPIIKEVVQAFFDKEPLCSINPDEVVALGASRLAHKLIHKDDGLLLLDVTPLSLGLETMGGLAEVVIPKNTPIPVARRQTFTTHSDNQTGMVIHIVQGEREMVSDCRTLGKFTLTGIPPMKAGIAKVEVTFAIDVNGQLTVSAMELSTKVASKIEVTPSAGLSERQQEALLKAGFLHAKDDKIRRSVVETKVEAQREIVALMSALDEFGTLLSDSQKDELHAKIQAVKTVIDDMGDIELLQKEFLEPQLLQKDRLDRAVNALKPLSDHFASVIMNQNVKQALSGTKTTDWQ